VVRTLRLFKRHHMTMLHVVLAALVLNWLGFKTVRAAVTPCEALRHSAIQAVVMVTSVSNGVPPSIDWSEICSVWAAR
jgi:hypothetical protein